MRNSEAVAGGFNGKLFDITNPKMPYICHGYPLSNRPHGVGNLLTHGRAPHGRRFGVPTRSRLNQP